MKRFREMMGGLMGRNGLKSMRRSPRRRSGFAPLAESLENRTVLSQVTFGPAIVAPHRAEGGPADILKVQVPSIVVSGQTNQAAAPGNNARPRLVHLGASGFAAGTGGAGVGAMVAADDSGTVESTGQSDTQADNETGG